MPGDLKKLVYASEYNIKEGNYEKLYKVANVKCYAVLNSHTQGFDLTVFSLSWPSVNQKFIMDFSVNII